MKTQTCKRKTLLVGVTLVALATAPLVHADYSNTVISQGPVGYWRLNETTQPSPASGAANSGGSLGVSAAGSYLNFATKGLPGPFAGSSAVGVDGLGQAVTSPYQVGLNPAQFTIEAWVNPASATVPNGLLCVASSMFSSSPRQGWLIYQSDGTTAGAEGVGYYLRLYATNGAAQSISLLAPQVVVPGTWTHLVYTFDGTTAKAFINGALVGSGVPTANGAGLRFVPNTSAQYSIGMRSDGGFAWPGKIAEVAYYGSALPDAGIANHYTVATTTPANYAATVQANSPLVYYRFQEAADVVATNSSLAGSSLNGFLIYDAKAGVAGPATPTYAGFEAANKAVAFDNGGGVVRIPPLNLNTNTVTISCWINATNSQPIGAGIVLHGSGANACGLTIDQIYGGLGLGYIWNGNNYGFSPNVDLGLPALPDSQWAYAALVIRPSQAEIYICDANNFANFTSITNSFQVTHASQAFASPTLVGAAAGLTAPAGTLNGAVDEVTIFNRALSAGELYTQYASAVGAVEPRFFSDLQGPAGDVAAGDPIVLSVDAGGTPDLVYTWYKDNAPVAATTNSGIYTIASATLGDGGTYKVTITNSFGTATSQDLFLTVVNPTPPVITDSQGFYASRVLYPTGTLHLAVSATGGGLKYQWYRNGTAIPSATASSYTVASVTAANAGSYTVIVTNSVGAATNGPAGIVVPTVATGSYEAAIVGSGPEAWWRLDETPGSTNLFDGVGRHDGFYTNVNGSGPLPTMGVAGALVGNPNTAASFGAAGAVGLVPFSPKWNSSLFTVEIWARTTNVNDEAFGVPISSGARNTAGWGWANLGGEWAWYKVDADGGAVLDDTEDNAYVVVPGGWTHLVLIYDESFVSGGNIYPYSFYINGKTDGFVHRWTTTTGLTGSAPLTIGGGAFPVWPDSFFNGQVDEIAIYSRELTLTEITNHLAARGVEYIAPTFSTSPLSQTVTAGKSISFSATAVGTPSPTYQWYKDGTPINGATNTTYAIASVASGNAGSYSLRAANIGGTNFSTAAILTVLPATAYANVTNDLVLHLKFEGDVQDSSGKGNNGTASSSPGPNFVTGKVGAQAAQFTTTLSGSAFASASYVDLGTPADLLFGSGTSFTVGLWVKLPANAEPGDVPFIGTEVGAANNDGWFIGPSYQAGGWQWNLNDGTGNFGIEGPDNSINDGNWHYFLVAVDRTSAVVKSYLDGILVANTGISGLGSIDVGGTVTIAQDPSKTYPEAAVFTLDDIGIWRRALTPAEVASIESAGRAGNSFDTVAPAAVTLSIAPSGSNLQVSWSPAIGTLLEAASATGPWTTNNSSSPYIVGPSNAARFYRVQLP